VYRAIDKRTKEVFAIKILPVDEDDQEQYSKTLKEIELLKVLRFARRSHLR
jgi:hypothetical protein